MPELYILILTVPIILLSLVIHEFAHGMVSYKLGDPTPKLMGRLTLNPFAHLDPFGTLMIVITMVKGFGFAGRNRCRSIPVIIGIQPKALCWWPWPVPWPI